MDNQLYLRFVDLDDKDLLLGWANDSTLRKNSFNTETISSEAHERWFHKVLNTNNIKFFMMMNGNIPVGQIRLEVKDDIGIVSYSIAEKYRGLGYGKLIVKQLENWVRDHFDAGFTIIGLVKKSNRISRNLFETLDYEINEKEEYIEYLKKL